MVVGIVLNIAVIAYAALRSYPMDYGTDRNLIVDPAKMAIDTYKGCGFFLAVLISWSVDRRWLHYEVSGTPIERVTWYVAGVLGYFAVQYIIVPLLPGTILGTCMDRFIPLIYVMLVVLHIKLLIAEQLFPTI